MALRLLPDLPEFKMLAKSLRISAKRELNDGVQFWAVQNAPAQLGASEVEQATERALRRLWDERDGVATEGGGG